eukprot:symbB.v1.2.022536.t1/scaffold2007.1/size92683/1
MLSNQAEHLSQSALTRFAVIVRLMTQVLPMPLPLDHPCKESRCFWMQEMKHETKVDLMRNLFLMARHFAAACFTLRARRDTDGARVVVSAALAAVMDTLLRRCLTDTLHGSLASRHYAGLAPGPCSAFGVELGEFHSASETLLLVAPEYQALRTLVLDYFDSVSRCVAAEHMIFSFDKSMACSEGEMTLVEQIGLCLGLDAAKRDAPRLLTGERPELIELFPELAWFRDTVFLWKMLLLPACQCPAVQKWSSADSLLKWQYRKGRFEVIGFGTTLTAEANGKGDSFFRGVLRWFGQYDSDKKSLSRANPSVAWRFGGHGQVSAGAFHTVLLRSNGQAVACGSNSDGQCTIPPLDEGLSYSQVSAGGGHTVLLRSNGQAVACGSNSDGQCSIPPLDKGISYSQVSAGESHTVLLRSDGQAVAFGDNSDWQCKIPPLRSWRDWLLEQNNVCDITNLSLLGKDRVVQVDFLFQGDAGVILTCVGLDGVEVLRLKVQKSDRIVDVESSVVRELNTNVENLRMVLPDARLLDPISEANPFATLSDVISA